MVDDVSNAIVYLSGGHLLSGPSPCSRITGDHCVQGSESRYDTSLYSHQNTGNSACIVPGAVFAHLFVLLYYMYNTICIGIL